MKTIHFITGNKSKFKEAKLILKNVKLVRKDLKLLEPKDLSQRKVVLLKAMQAYKKIKKPVIVDDTCIYFKAYNDFPGTYTKYLFKSIGFKGVEKLLKNSNREAYFKTMICYKDRSTIQVFEGIWKGKIVSKISKMYNPDWQYNSIFVPNGFRKPLSEISMEERAKHSHRKKAFDKLRGYFK